MILNEYNSLIREYFDFSDRETTKYIKYINESDQQSQLLAALAGALYDKIVDKSKKVDFGSIPRSRGDITKVDGYNNTVECINIIRRLVVEYKEDPSIIDIELTAIENVKALRPLFIKGFNNNASLPMMYYNLTVCAIQHSVSFLIAVAIQFGKDPNTKNIHMALDKAAYEDAESNMVLEQLAQFNKAYAKGDIEKILRASIGGIRESVENDEFSEKTISTTNDVTDAIEKAPEADTTGLADDELREDTLLLKIAGGDSTEEPEEEQPPVASPFADDNTDELSAGANSPDTIPDDEVDPTPIIPINGEGEIDGTQAVEEKRGSIVKGHYHKHPSANMGYGSKHEGVLDVVSSPEVRTAIKNAGQTVVQVASEPGEVRKNVFDFLKGNSKVKTALIGVGAGLSVLWLIIKVIIPGLRCLVSYYWAGRADLSESLAAQANLIEINALELEANQDTNLSDEKKAKVVEKQMKVAQKLRSWAEKIAIKDKKTSKDVKKEIEDENKRTKISDIKNQLPDDADGLF